MLNKGFVDIHSHVLWGVDDGPHSLQETVALCDMASETGTKALFLTPHLMYWESAEDLYDERELKYERLSDVLMEEDISLDIYKGFEILCDDDIFDIKHFKPYTLCGSRYILIEFDFFKTTTDDVISWCSYLKASGVIPVIAHPERYEFMLFDHSAVDKLSDLGVLFQINSGSAAGAFGEEVQDFAIRMINLGYADFIGSDAHDYRNRNTDLSICFENYPYGVNMDLLERAACDNPLKIVSDKPVVIERLGVFKEK